MSGSFQNFLRDLRLRESSGDYTAVNSYGYLGAYQFGEAALIDLGVVNHDGSAFNNDFSGGFTGSYGVTSVADFLTSPNAQDEIAKDWFDLLWARIRYYDIDHYVGQVLNGVELTKTAMLAASHLLGTGGLINFIRSGGTANLTDGYGTPIEQYMALFADYNTPARYQDRLNQDNTIAGGAGRDVLKGFGGGDLLTGRGARDGLVGGGGNDKLKGGRGGDTLFGGTGQDKLFGGRGADEFIFKGNSGRDVVRDFQDGVDQLVIRSGADRFRDLTITESGGDTKVAFADTVIILRGFDADDLSADDFTFV